MVQNWKILVERSIAISYISMSWRKCPLGLLEMLSRCSTYRNLNRAKEKLMWTSLWDGSGFFGITTRHNAPPALVNFLLHSANNAARLAIAQAFFVNIIVIAPRRAFIASQDYSSHFSIRELLQALYCTEAYQHVLVLNPPFAPYALRDVDSSHICKLCLHPTLRHLSLPFRNFSGYSSDRTVRDRFSLLF
jgi:hypothetical protein